VDKYTLAELAYNAYSNHTMDFDLLTAEEKDSWKRAAEAVHDVTKYRPRSVP
jgi:hypothetical protein